MCERAAASCWKTGSRMAEPSSISGRSWQLSSGLNRGAERRGRGRGRADQGAEPAPIAAPARAPPALPCVTADPTSAPAPAPSVPPTSLRQWRLGVERASYEASRAERRYRAVDPDNRLVARGLERMGGAPERARGRQGRAFTPRRGPQDSGTTRRALFGVSNPVYGRLTFGETNILGVPPALPGWQ